MKQPKTYDSVILSPSRLFYGEPVHKEGLVERPQDWPGVHCANALLTGESLTGHWFDHSREYAVRNQRQDFDRLRYATEETVTFSPIPCWAHLPPEVYRARIQALVDFIIKDAALARSSSGRPVEKTRRK